jgi:YD repeat-containing protein
MCGAATAVGGATRTYHYEDNRHPNALTGITDEAGVRDATTVTAPCPLWGNTQASSTYNANGNPTKQVAHGGTVTFTAYDAKGRETERDTFAASYDRAATRPALANATQVVCTTWHATFNLPTQVAEPNKTTANGQTHLIVSAGPVPRVHHRRRVRRTV